VPVASAEGAGREPGPKLLAGGRVTGPDPNTSFVERRTRARADVAFAWTRWIDYREDRLIRYEWVAPSVPALEKD
jgi:hypothetical protein